MNIFEKIEQIKEEPEYIRRRYVWVFVLISMFLIVGIWIISMKNSLSSSKELIKDSDRLNIMDSQVDKNENSINYEEYYKELNNGSANSSGIVSPTPNTSTTGDTSLTPGQ